MTDTPEPQEEPGQPKPPDPWKSFRGVMAGTLILEAIVVLLALPVVATIGGGLSIESRPGVGTPSGQGGPGRSSRTVAQLPRRKCQTAMAGLFQAARVAAGSKPRSVHGQSRQSPTSRVGSGSGPPGVAGRGVSR